MVERFFADCQSLKLVWDNTLSYADYDIKNVIQNLESDSLKMLDWFDYNLMKANPDKFQALAIGKKSFDHKIVFELKGNRIECDNDVKLLGITIDCELKFDKLAFIRL
jgi:hypothetical protein